MYYSIYLYSLSIVENRVSIALMNVLKVYNSSPNNKWASMTKAQKITMNIIKKEQMAVKAWYKVDASIDIRLLNRSSLINFKHAMKTTIDIR